MTIETITLGAGCFWCIETIYLDLKGVNKVVSGYSGGNVDNPTYEQVIGKSTGHAEVIQLEFDNTITNFKEILEIFFFIHDPTTLNRQGNDKGPQYRSAIFYHTDQQKIIAEQVIKDLDDQKIYKNKIVTEVTKIDKFWIAEDYHQNYYNMNQNQGYCSYVITPKVSKFREKYFAKLKN